MRKANKEKKPKKILKRNGTKADFEEERIASAIFRAFQSVDEGSIQEAENLGKKVSEKLWEKFSGKTPSVEDIQEIVEETLIKAGYAKTAKAYILYRKSHENLRKSRGSFLEVKKAMGEYLDRTDWRVNENSNADYSFSGLMFHVAEKTVANHVLNNIYTPRVSEAHRNADIHIHDLGMGIVAYCCGWSLKSLLYEGFGGVPKKIQSKAPKHLETACIQMVNFLGTMQMEHAGAQAFSSVDTLLAPFAKKDSLPYEKVKQNMQMLIFSLNVPSRWSCQAPFTNFTFDWTVPEDLKEEPALVGGEQQNFTYGECQKEMDMVNRAFIEVMLEGDAKGRTFFYPIPTYNITKEFDWESENAKLLFEMTAKYGTPYFQNFINSTLKPSDIRSMCCRLQLDLKELRSRMGGLFGAADQTGSIGVVTINLPRIGYMSKSMEELFERLSKTMGIAKEALETKRRVVEKNLENGLMPFARHFLGNYNNHFSTIGLNGMHEALLNFNGKGIETPEGKELAAKILGFMRGKLAEFQEETGNLYNLEATPCESATYRLAKKDLEMFPGITTAGTRERPYYTNSTHLPVNHTEDVFEALEHQDELQTLYTGGTVLHAFLGERLEDWESTKRLVKKISHNYRLPYFTITPTFSICPEHGYITGEHFSCPCTTGEKAEGTEQEKIAVAGR